jgi:hypothetical protein
MKSSKTPVDPHFGRVKETKEKKEGKGRKKTHLNKQQQKKAKQTNKQTNTQTTKQNKKTKTKKKQQH